MPSLLNACGVAVGCGVGDEAGVGVDVDDEGVGEAIGNGDAAQAANHRMMISNHHVCRKTRGMVMALRYCASCFTTQPCPVPDHSRRSRSATNCWLPR
jgi:hypothetical protein